MTSEIDKLYVQMGRMVESVQHIQITLARQDERMASHDTRASQLIEAVKTMKAELEPIKQHVNLVNRSFKILLATLGASGTVVGIVVGLAKLHL